MERNDKRSLVKIFQLVLSLLLVATLLTGCGSDATRDSAIGGPGSDVPGEPVARNSTIVVTPSAVPPDGESTATVTVSLADKDSRVVADGTMVWLNATVGTIVSDNPAETINGRARFLIQAPNSQGRATLALPDFPSVAPVHLVFGTPGSGEPASIRVDSVTPSEISVAGVGQVESSTIKLRVVDEGGIDIDSTDYTLRVRFLGRPQGGERLNESGSSHNNDYDQIDIPVRSQVVAFNLQAGNLPGVVEIEAELMYNNQSIYPAVKALVPQISIASGPPHILSLSAPRMDAVVNLNEGPDEGIPQTPGFYSRRAGLSVLDRFGNAVPDGTVINLGVIDTVIAEGEGGITRSDVLTHLNNTVGPVSFSNNYVVRNNTTRFIEPNDRVLILNARSQNKSRFVGSPISDGSHRLFVNRDYQNTESPRQYIVGASLLGASLYGINEDGTASKGTVRTVNGLGQIRFVYPANSNTIHVGYVPNDPRHWPAGSAQVVSVFSTSDNSATMIDRGTLGFSSIAGWELTASHETITSSEEIILQIVDGGDKIPLPFVTISPSVTIYKGALLEITATSCKTNTSGTCVSTITITGSVPEDAAVITYSAGDAEPQEVSFFVPKE